MDFEWKKKLFDSMSWQEQKQFAEQNKNNPEFQQFANQYLGGNKQATQPTQPSNPAPVENNTQNQTSPNGQNWENGGWNQQTSAQAPQTQTQAQAQPQGHQFGYQTDETYRKQRDSQYAEQLFMSNPNAFDYNSVYNYIHQQAPDVSPGEVRNTVENIQRQYHQLSRASAMNGLSAEKIREGLLNGTYSQNDLEQLRLKNPEKYNEYLAYHNKRNTVEDAAHNAKVLYNLWTENTVKEEKNTEEILLQIVEKFFGRIEYNDNIAKEYKEALNSPNIQKQKEKMLNAQKEMDEIDDELEILRADIKKQYPWIPKSQLNAIVQDRSVKLLKRKNELHKDYQRAKGDVQFEMNLAGMKFEADLKGIQIEREEFSDKMTALGFAKGIFGFETPQQQRDAELEQIKKKSELEAEFSDINSKDPKIQFNAVMKALDPHYKEFGSIILRPQAQAAQDIINLAKREKISVGEAMRKNFTEELFKKPEYSVMMSKKTGISVGQKVMNIWGKPYIQTTNPDGTVSLALYGGSNSQSSTTYQWPDYTPVSSEKVQSALKQLNAQWDGSKWGQCWYFVNNYLESLGIGRLFTDPISAKKAVVNSSTPSIGSVAVIDRTNSPNASQAQKKYGHVGVVVWINKDGSVELKQSNKNWEEKIFTSNYKTNQIYGYFDPTIAKQNTNELSVDEIINFNDKSSNRKLSSADKKRIGDLKNQVMSDPNADIEKILSYSQGGDKLTDTPTQSLVKYGQVLNQIGVLQGLLEWQNSGPILGILRSKNPYDQKARQIQVAINAMIPTLARWVYGEVGVLTDNDIAHYTKTVPNLKTPESTNTAILAMTLNMLAQGYKNQLRTLAAAGKDVSGFWGLYKNIMDEVQSLQLSSLSGETPTRAKKYRWENNVLKTSGGDIDEEGFIY